MLFWAGLRGAVGVALAAGFTGNNAQTLRTTVLVVVVLTVVIFGGTTARMLEVLGIRTGVEDDAESSEDEDSPANRGAWNANRNSGGRWGRYMDDESGPGFTNPTSYRAYVRGAGRIGTHYGPNNYNHQAQAPASPLNNNTIFSAASSDSIESDNGEVLPMATTSGTGGDTATPPRTDVSALGGTAIVGDDGKWFQTLDERYLLPIFSNATASRTFHARRARRTASGANVSANVSTTGTPVDSEDEGDMEVELGGGGAGNGNRSRELQPPPLPPAAQADESRSERGLGSPMLRTYSSDGQSRPLS
jgi:sodium/hydrogen exchanger-like protein 6/7